MVISVMPTLKAFASQTELEWPSFSLKEISECVQKEFFPTQPVIDAYYAPIPTLACITFPPPTGEFMPYITINSLLNHPETPREIIEHIVKHEYLHIEIPGREVNGKFTSHPPEFIEKEKTLSPDSSRVWIYLYVNFGSAIKRRSRKECFSVSPTGFKLARWESRVPIDKCLEQF